jgi:hypothetical protein
MDFLDNAFEPAASMIPAQKSQEGLRDISELFDPSVQLVRGEFFDYAFKPKIHITHKSIVLSPSCARLFPDCQHFSVYLDEQNVRLILVPTTEADKNGLKLSNIKDSKVVPRPCTAKYFCARLFRFMEWSADAKYRILAIYQEIAGRKVLVFSLFDCRQVLTTIVEGEDGKKKRHTTLTQPLAWKGTFGDTIAKYAEKKRVDFNSPMLTVNHKTGEVIRVESW